MKIHIVKKGDTLYELAKKYHTTLDQIIALNPQIADPNQIEIGMKVKIPSVVKPVEPPASDFVYKHVVQQGDSLWKLGKAWDVPLQAMIKANAHLKNPNVLMTGDVVFVPKMQHGHTQSNQHGAHQTHHNTSKLSTEPFAPVPMTQPMLPTDAYQQPIIPSPQQPVVEVPPLSTGETVPAVPQITQQAPVIPAPVMEDHGLHQPYGQAVHPFQQFHITATEVFAYPEQQHEAMTYPAYSPYQEEPCEPLGAMAAPVNVVDEGCGCGGPSVNEHPWMNYPAPYANVPMGNPWDHMSHEMPVIPAFYPPPMPYDHPMAQHYAFQHDPYGIPYVGAGQHAPYEESSLLPQVHTHELKKVSDTLEEIEIDIRDKQKSAKPKTSGSRTTRKVKLSGASALGAFLQQQHRGTEKREPSRPNSPWINNF
ncbi:LysM peptidoglycan-binding domain-containing protein [Paenibacillus sp. LjRoot153]|uniref:LysM peptidoglycan-binding domain-containing protein n=1 Tax=Paenibacillus sp. LjRoot153 TaxID=3342270 RepID=UPI003ECD5013